MVAGLLDDGDRLVDVPSTAELGDRDLEPDAVIVDVPPAIQRPVLDRVRRRFAGRLIVLVDRDEHTGFLPPDPARVLVRRPFRVDKLQLALTAPLPMAADEQDEPPRKQEAPVPRTPTKGGNFVYRPAYGWARRLSVLGWAGLGVAAAMVLLVLFSPADRHGCGPGCNVVGASETTRTTVVGVRPPDVGSPSDGPTAAKGAPTPGATPSGFLAAASAYGGAAGGGSGLFTSSTFGVGAGASRRSSGTAPLGSFPPGSDSPGTTSPDTSLTGTAPPTTAPATTAPPTTAPSTTAPPTTAPPTTAPPTTAPPTTAPPPTDPPTTAPTTTPTTAQEPTTQAPTTAPTTTT